MAYKTTTAATIEPTPPRRPPPSNEEALPMKKVLNGNCCNQYALHVRVHVLLLPSHSSTPTPLSSVQLFFRFFSPSILHDAPLINTLLPLNELDDLCKVAEKLFKFKTLFGFNWQYLFLLHLHCTPTRTDSFSHNYRPTHHHSTLSVWGFSRFPGPAIRGVRKTKTISRP